MKKHKLKKSVGIFAMLAVAIGLLAFSSIGGARAALTYTSEIYTSQFEMFDIGVTLKENGNPVSTRNWNKNKRDFDADSNNENDRNKGILLNDITKFEFGTKYEEKITVQNTGTIDEYVILTIRRYWIDKEGKKRTDLDPRLIQLQFSSPQSNKPKWIVDTKNSNDKAERIIMIYDTPLTPGTETLPATEWITVDSAIKAEVSTKEEVIEGVRTIISTYSYDGLKFVVEAEAEGVQTHNAVDAIHSAWGRQVTIDPESKQIIAIN